MVCNIKKNECNKVSLTKKEAEAALKFKDKRTRKYRREIRYYHCPRCNWWHLTSHEDDQTLDIKIQYKKNWKKLLDEKDSPKKRNKSTEKNTSKENQYPYKKMCKNRKEVTRGPTTQENENQIL